MTPQGLITNKLIAFLAQVEDYLKEVNKSTGERADAGGPSLLDEPEPQFDDFEFGTGGGTAATENESSKASETPQGPSDIPSFFPDQSNAESFFNDTQLMGLGMTEALPPFEVMEEL